MLAFSGLCLIFCEKEQLYLSIKMLYLFTKLIDYTVTTDYISVQSTVVF